MGKMKHLYIMRNVCESKEKQKQKHQKHSFYVSLATKYLNRVNSADSSYSTKSPPDQARSEQASHFHLKERE